MRLHFREKPWDLYVAVGYTVVMAAVLLALNVGNLLAILLVLFVPGYVLVAALFPGGVLPEKPEIDWIERIALSFGLSIAVVPLLGPGGNASGYPTNLTVNETGNVIIGVANHEGATVSYTVLVDLVVVRIVYNSSSGFNQTVEVNRTVMASNASAVANGANWTYPYRFSIPTVGLWKVQLLLFKDAVFTVAYRELHLYVTVT